MRVCGRRRKVLSADDKEGPATRPRTGARGALDGLGWPESGSSGHRPSERLGWPDDAAGETEETSELEHEG